jgi:hypothetical protein
VGRVFAPTALDVAAAEQLSISTTMAESSLQLGSLQLCNSPGSVGHQLCQCGDCQACPAQPLQEPSQHSESPHQHKDGRYAWGMLASASYFECRGCLQAARHSHCRDRLSRLATCPCTASIGHITRINPLGDAANASMRGDKGLHDSYLHLQTNHQSHCMHPGRFNGGVLGV